MTSVVGMERSLSVGSMDGWVDAAPAAGRCGRKASIDSVSSWCLPDVEDPEDWVQEGDPNDPSSAPPSPFVVHVAPISRRSSVASWSGDDSWMSVRREDGRRNSNASIAASEEYVIPPRRRESFGVSEGEERREVSVPPLDIEEESPSERVDRLFAQMDSPRGPQPPRHPPKPRVPPPSRYSQAYPALNDRPVGPHDNPILHISPSFADVVRAPTKPKSVVRARDVRPRGGIQRRVLRAPRVRPNAGLEMLKKCNRTLSISMGTDMGGIPPRKVVAPRRSGPRKDNYYLPAIYGIPEEEEEAKVYERKESNLNEDSEEADSAEEEILKSCVRSLSISEDVDEVPLSELFAEEPVVEICEPISP